MKRDSIILDEVLLTAISWLSMPAVLESMQCFFIVGVSVPDLARGIKLPSCVQNGSLFIMTVHFRNFHNPIFLAAAPFVPQPTFLSKNITIWY